MDIQTTFGLVKNIEIKKFTEDTFSLGYLKEPNSEGEYTMFGFDMPTQEDPYWRFWVGYGDSNGMYDSNDAGISTEDREEIKKMFYEWIKQNCVDDFRICEISFKETNHKQPYSVFVEAFDEDEALEKMKNNHLYDEPEDLDNIESVAKLSIAEYFSDYILATDH